MGGDLRARAWATLLLGVVLLATACGPGRRGDDGLRESVREVWSFTTDQPYPIEAPSFRDVIRDGSAMYVLYQRGDVPGLFWTEDDGTTWDHALFGEAATGSGGPSAGGLMLHEERIYLIMGSYADNSYGLSVWRLALDGATPSATWAAGHMRTGGVHRLGGSQWGQMWIGNTTLTTFRSFRYWPSFLEDAPAPNVDPSDVLPYTSAPDRCLPASWDLAGSSEGRWRFAGVCTLDAAVGGGAPRLCEASIMSGGDPALQVACADLSREVDANDLVTFAGGDRVVLYYTAFEDGARRARAAWLTRDPFGHATAHTADLGAGYLHVNRPGWLAVMKRGFGPFASVVRPDQPLDASATFHFLDVAQNQIATADLPASPCAPDVACGRAPYALNGGGAVFLPTDEVVRWIQPMGANVYRIFYAIETGDPERGEPSKVRVLYDDVTWTPPPPPQITARPAGPLVEACALASLCADGVADAHRLNACASWWTEIGHAPRRDEDDPRLAAFLGATDCDAVQRAWPEQSPPPALTCTGDAICDDDVGYECSAGVPVQAVAVCGDGTECVVGGWARCDTAAQTCGAAPSAMFCVDDPAPGACAYGTFLPCAAQGRTCHESVATGLATCVNEAPRCEVPLPGEPTVGSYCDGDVLARCGNAGVSEDVWDCARRDGFMCQESEVERPTGPYVEALCLPEAPDCSSTTATCDGSRLTYCDLGASGTGLTRALDCADVGAACRADGESPRCVVL